MYINIIKFTKPEGGSEHTCVVCAAPLNGCLCIVVASMDAAKRCGMHCSVEGLKASWRKKMEEG